MKKIIHEVKMKILLSITISIIMLMSNSVFSKTEPSISVHPNDPSSYKDSFYFGYGGNKYLVVSDLTRGSVSLLKAYNNNDSDYRYHKTIISGNYWAPIVVHRNGSIFTVITSHIAPVPSNSKLQYFRYDMNSLNITTSVQDLNLGGGELGMIDPTIWYETSKGKWYLMGSKWQPNVLGSRLQWAYSDNIEGPYTFPIDLYNAPNVTHNHDAHRIDWLLGGTYIDWVVEAPIWSWWDHNSDGKHELYWSVGPSEPCAPGKTSIIRRGDINWSGLTPWISIWNTQNGGLDFVGTTNISCGRNLLTHPDFTETGNVRATSYSSGRYTIVKQPSW